MPYLNLNEFKSSLPRLSWARGHCKLPQAVSSADVERPNVNTTSAKHRINFTCITRM